MPFDLSLRVDKSSIRRKSLQRRMDVGIRAGRIAQIGASAWMRPAVRDVRDDRAANLCVRALSISWPLVRGQPIRSRSGPVHQHGVTTAVDAGSTGYANFPEFRRTVMNVPSRIVLAFVHISFMGLHAPYAEELVDLRYARPTETAEVIGETPRPRRWGEASDRQS